MYHFNEGSLDLPESWIDQTINIVSSSGSLEPGLTITMTRDAIPWGMGFSEYVEDQIAQVTEALTDFALLGRKPVTAGRSAAYEIECRWKAKSGPMHQITTTVQLSDNRALVLTASHPGEMTANQQTEVRRIISTLNLQQRRG